MEKINKNEFIEFNDYVEGMLMIEDNHYPKIKFYPDVIYCQKDGIDLMLKIVAPVTTDNLTRFPLLVHIQGSAWQKQDLNCNLANLLPIVEAGYILAIVQYRWVPNHRFPSQIEDGKTAMRFLMANADNYQIDMDKVFLSGDSSGGHTAMCMMASWDSLELDFEKTKLPKLKACIDLYGSLDCLTMNDGPSDFDHDDINSPASVFLGFQAKTDPQKAYQMTPFYYINSDTNLPPVLIMHGTNDRVVPFIQSLNFYNYLRNLKKDCVLYAIKGADHGGIEFYNQATLKVIVDFLNMHQ